MKKVFSIIVACAFFAVPALAQKGELSGTLDVKARVGYSIGGTAPLGMPATIRSIDSFRLTPSLTAGVDATLSLGQGWGVLAGLYVENKGMKAEVTTKGYRMEVVKGDSRLSGLFTGHVQQDVTQWMLTIPVKATYAVSRTVSLKAGPYLSVLLSKNFSGIASDGYLRQGDPTGPRIDMGSVEGEWATYDFSEDMRRLQMGLSAGIDWQVYKNIGLSADLNWGLTGIFPGSFETVEQTLYPIYGTIGVFYRFF